MALQVVRGCDTASCEREARCEITDHGQHLAWYCRPCMTRISRVLDRTSHMVKHGTPHSIAADWAVGYERRKLAR